MECKSYNEPNRVLEHSNMENQVSTSRAIHKLTYNPANKRTYQRGSQKSW